MWEADIRVANRKIVARYKHNHIHNVESIHKILRILATVDTARDRQKKVAGRIGRYGQPGDDQATTAGTTIVGAPYIPIGERKRERTHSDNLIQ